MADDKNKPRTMRSDPPAHKNEALRHDAKTCVESIRNRKGVGDHDTVDLYALKPSSESALEFAPDVMGDPTAVSGSSSAIVAIDSAPADVEVGFAAPMMLEAQPVPLVDMEAARIQPVGFLASHPAPVFKPATAAMRERSRVKQYVDRSRLMLQLDQIQHMIEIEAATSTHVRRDLTAMMSIIRDPTKRPASERFSAHFNLADIMRVVMARLSRFKGVAVTPLTKDVVKREIGQIMTELIELDLVEMP